MKHIKKPIVQPFVRDVTLAILLGFALTYALNVRMEHQKSLLKSYQEAAACTDLPTCKQVVNATIVSSSSVRRITELTSKHSTSFRLDFNYFVSAKTENGQEFKVKILPLVSTDSNAVYPLDSFKSYEYLENDFAETAFIVGDNIQMEIWMNQPVLLLTRRMKTGSEFNTISLLELFNGYDPSTLNNIDVGTVFLPNVDPASPAFKAIQEDKTQNLTPQAAVLTTQNPAWILSQIMDNHTSSLIGIWFVVTFFFIVRWIFSLH